MRPKLLRQGEQRAARTRVSWPLPDVNKPWSTGDFKCVACVVTRAPGTCRLSAGGPVGDGVGVGVAVGEAECVGVGDAECVA